MLWKQDGNNAGKGKQSRDLTWEGETIILYNVNVKNRKRNGKGIS